MMRLAIVSGGMDSTVLAYHLRINGQLGGIVSFDYGQRHAKELDFAEATARTLDVSYQCVRLPLDGLLEGSALTDSSVEVPDGHYAEETMRATVVPNRNMMMLSVAAAIAIAGSYDSVATAVHAGDHFVYPDCRPAFVSALTTALRVGNEGFCAPGFDVHAPFLMRSKAEIAAAGHQLDVPWDETWSCYKGGDVHCGACGTCFERREAFDIAGVVDPTVYSARPEYVAP